MEFESNIVRLPTVTKFNITNYHPGARTARGGHACNISKVLQILWLSNVKKSEIQIKFNKRIPI